MLVCRWLVTLLTREVVLWARTLSVPPGPGARVGAALQTIHHTAAGHREHPVACQPVVGDALHASVALLRDQGDAASTRCDRGVSVSLGGE